MALTGAGLSGRGGRRAARARFIPVLAGGGACPVSGLDQGSAGLEKRVGCRGRQSAYRSGFRFSGHLWDKNRTSKDNRCRLKDRKFPIFVFALTGSEPKWIANGAP